MFDEKGRPISAVQAADHLIALASKKPLWSMVEKILDIWFRQHPESYREHDSLMNEVRETRKNDSAISDSGRMRYMGEIPHEVAMMFDLVLYKQIKEYGDKKFYREFFRKYPFFRSSRKAV